jgi:hypothetical protein
VVLPSVTAAASDEFVDVDEDSVPHQTIELIEADASTGEFPSEQDADDETEEPVVPVAAAVAATAAVAPPRKESMFEVIQEPGVPLPAPAPPMPIEPVVQPVHAREEATASPAVAFTPVRLHAAPDAEPEPEIPVLLSTRPIEPTYAPVASPLFATAAPQTSSFPWLAVGAVAVAGILIGTVIGYGYARNAVIPGVAAPVARVADTEVKVPDESTVAPAPAPSSTPAPPPAESKPVAPTTAPATSTTAPTAPPLTVRSSPEGAMLVVDGHPKGQTPVTVRDLAPGNHTVEVAHPGFVPRTERVALSLREPEKTMSIELEPGLPDRAAASAATSAGAVYVDSRPRGARVTIDGRFFGTAPMRVSEVSAGVHTVRLDLNGFQSFVSDVVVRPGEQARVTAALEERERPNR